MEDPSLTPDLTTLHLYDLIIRGPSAHTTTHWRCSHTSTDSGLQCCTRNGLPTPAASTVQHGRYTEEGCHAALAGGAPAPRQAACSRNSSPLFMRSYVTNCSAAPGAVLTQFTARPR